MEKLTGWVPGRKFNLLKAVIVKVARLCTQTAHIGYSSASWVFPNSGHLRTTTMGFALTMYYLRDLLNVFKKELTFLFLYEFKHLHHWFYLLVMFFSPDIY